MDYLKIWIIPWQNNQYLPLPTGQSGLRLPFLLAHFLGHLSNFADGPNCLRLDGGRNHCGPLFGCQISASHESMVREGGNTVHIICICITLLWTQYIPLLQVHSPSCPLCGVLYHNCGRPLQNALLFWGCTERMRAFDEDGTSSRPSLLDYLLHIRY